MSSMVLSGDTSGAVTLSVPAVAGTNTITVPAATGTMLTTASTGVVTQAMLSTGVAGNGPAFSAYRNATQSLANGAITKVQFNTEQFDTASCFDSTTNYRFTPNVAGYYQFNALLAFIQSGSGTGNYAIYFYKNGSQVFQYNNFCANAYNPFAMMSTLIYMNGSTDYLEVYAYQNYASPATIAGTDATGSYFQGFLARAA